MALHFKSICKRVNQLCINYHPYMQYASMSKALPLHLHCRWKKQTKMRMYVQGECACSKDGKRKYKVKRRMDWVGCKFGVHAIKRRGDRELQPLVSEPLFYVKSGWEVKCTLVKKWHPPIQTTISKYIIYPMMLLLVI